MSKQTSPVTVISTVRNEAATVTPLLESLWQQTVLPHEVIVVDGGSEDDTVRVLEQLAQRDTTVPLKVVAYPSTRSVGRNHAVALATTKLIACIDAGCTADRRWLEELVATYVQKKTPVVAGYYAGAPRSAFEEAQIPYVLVMPDKAREPFLPATRSMLFEKAVFEGLGGFPIDAPLNEDYVFARRLVSENIPIAFAKQAVVYWRPRATVSAFSAMLFAYARGDMTAGIIRPKVVLLFARYLFGALLLWWLWVTVALHWPVMIAISILLVYASWAVAKNYRYAPRSWWWFPVLQLTADAAVLGGSSRGALERILKEK